MKPAKNSAIDRAEMAAAFAEASETVRTGSAEQHAGRVLTIGPVTELRQRLGLTRAEFAARYRVPIETLHAWEGGKVELDAVAKALLALIAADPEAVARLLAARTPAAAE